MGGGKGASDHWVAVIHRGRILFELAGVDESAAKEAMRLASYKLPFETRFLVREAIGQVSKKEAATVEG
jgi:large subunit ribosomal protein L16